MHYNPESEKLLMAVFEVLSAGDPGGQDRLASANAATGNGTARCKTRIVRCRKNCSAHACGQWSGPDLVLGCRD